MNKVASECCGSCEHYKNNSRFPCAKYHNYVRIGELCCYGEHYSPCNPIPIIDLPEVKELIEAAYRKGFQDGVDCGRESGEHYTKAYEENNVYEYMKTLENKDE